MPASTETAMPTFSYDFDLDGFVYTLRFHARSRDEADAQMRELLTGSSFQHWLDKMLPIDDERIGSVH